MKLTSAIELREATNIAEAELHRIIDGMSEQSVQKTLVAYVVAACRIIRTRFGLKALHRAVDIGRWNSAIKKSEEAA